MSVISLVIKTVIALSLKGVHENELDHYSGCCALGIDIYHPGLNAGLRYDGFHLPGDIVEAVVGRCADLNGSLHFLYLIRG